MAKLSAREQKVRKAATAAKAAPKLAPKAPKALMGAGPLLPGQSRVANSYSGNKPALVGEGPLLPGQKRVQKPKSSLKGAGPLLPGQSRVENSYNGGGVKPSNPRSLAAGAFNMNANQQPQGYDFGTISQAPDEGFFGGLIHKAKNGVSGIMADLGRATVGNSVGMASPNAWLSEEQRQANRDTSFGMPKASAAETPWGSAANPNTQPDIPTGYGPQGEIFYNGNTRMSPLKSDFATPGTNFSRPGSEQAYLRGEDPRVSNDGQYGTPLKYNQPKKPSNPFGFPVAQADETQQPNSPTQDFNLPEDANYQYNPSPTDPASIKEQQFAELMNQIQGNQGNDNAPQEDPYFGVQPTGGTVRQKLGSGAFGNGGMVGTPAGLTKEEKNYIKELRASAGGDYGASAVKSQFEELINALNPTYDLQQQNATNELEQAKNEDINRLRSMFASNNTAGSEQQQQFTQRAQNDSNTQLANLLAKLAVSKNSDIANYRSKMQGQLADVEQSKKSAQQRVMELIRQVQEGAQTRGEKNREFAYRQNQDNFDNNYKMASLSGKGSTKATTAGSVTYLGDDANGNPVYRNNKTGQREVGTGLKRKAVDPITQLLQGLQGGGQRQQVQYDENGRPYIEN